MADYRSDSDSEGEVYDSRSIARAQSAHILSKKNEERDKLRRKFEQQKKETRMRYAKKRQDKVGEWQKKMKRSPFRVDLLAENERIDEENRIRLREETRREKKLTKKKDQVKNEIILKALSETSDLEALRREKRAIQMEEKRLKALLDLEKTNSHRKQDSLAAQRAERQRKQNIAEHSRALRISERSESERAATQLLAAKLGVSGKVAGPFSY